MEEKGQFYFQGSWFDSSEEMFEYVDKWQHFPLDQETAERILDRLKKDIVMNVFMTGQPFTNAKFSEYVERIFEFSMIELHSQKNELRTLEHG